MTTLQAVPQSSLSEREFVKRAIQVLPAKGSGHVGIAPYELEGSFKKHFRKSSSQTINDMIRESVVVLARLERAEEGNERGSHRLTQIKFLEALPTKKVRSWSVAYASTTVTHYRDPSRSRGQRNKDGRMH